jgi:hypothetical protein
MKTETKTPQKKSVKVEKSSAKEQNGPQSPQQPAQSENKQNLPPVQRIIAGLFKSIAVEENEVRTFHDF